MHSRERLLKFCTVSTMRRFKQTALKYSSLSRQSQAIPLSSARTDEANQLELTARPDESLRRPLTSRSIAAGVGDLDRYVLI